MLKTIQAEKEEFETQDIQIVEGFLFNQKETIERIYLYFNSKYISGEMDTEGQKKFFYNINRNPCKVTTKAIDFDTKHINVQTAAGGDPLKTWYFERDLKFWMKDQNFGKVLNRIFAELPIFGSVVLKVINGKPQFVDLRNFIVEASADTLGQANYIIEEHLYTPMEFRKVGKELKWDKVEKAIEEFRKMDIPYMPVYERYGEEEMEDEKGNKTYEYRRTYIVDVGTNEVDERTGDVSKQYEGIILQTDPVDTHPYWEFHLEKIPGRWLGVGVVETLFDPQIRVNEVSNLQAKANYWSSLQVWQTRDEGINRNLFTDMVNGEILNVESEITKIDVSDRNLAGYTQETEKWMKIRDELTFSYEVIRGERLPAGTPLGSARLAAGMAGGHFDQIQENIALAIKEFLYKIIIPNFETENSKEHTLRLAGEDLDKLRRLIINQKAVNQLFRFIARKKKIPNQIQYDLIKTALEERVNQQKEILTTIPAEYYKNTKYKIDIIITGEQKDSAVYAAALFAALQAVTVDPTLLTDPTKKKFFFRWLEQGGISPIDIEPEVAKPLAERLPEIAPTRVGGGVSRPTPMAGAVPERTV